VTNSSPANRCPVRDAADDPSVSGEFLPSGVSIDELRILRFLEVRRLTRLSRSTIWRMESAGQFPARRQLSARAVGWVASEVEERPVHKT